MANHHGTVSSEEPERELVSMLDIFRHALRQSPDRLIIGELRGPEAFDFTDIDSCRSER